MSSKYPQIFVTRLPRDITEDDLKKSFRKFGKIKEVTLKKGYGFVEFDDYKSVKEAVAEMHDQKINGQRIVVEKAGERRSVKERRGPQADDKCFNCNERGHW